MSDVSVWQHLRAILLLPALAYRMRVEERLLAAQFGAEYRAYAEQTKRLVPGLW